MSGKYFNEINYRPFTKYNGLQKIAIGLNGNQSKLWFRSQESSWYDKIQILNKVWDYNCSSDLMEALG